MKNKLVQKSKRLLSGIVATAIAASMLPTLPAMAEETTEKYPYTLFAGSSEEGAITVNAGNFCVNGNIATNGTISCSNPLTGHGFLVYKSAVNDTLDFTGFVRGYTYQTWEQIDPCFYDIKCGQSVSIGNSGAAVGGSSVPGESGSNSGGSSVGSSGGSSGSSAGPSSGSSSGSEGDVAGIYFNREFAVEANNYIENYDSSNPNDFEQAYDKNYAYTKKITQTQWDELIKYHNEHNTYDLLLNNCILVATKAWNLIYPDDQIDTNTIPSVVKDRIKEKPNSFVYDLYTVLGYSI